MLTERDSGPYKVQVLDRAVAILDLLSNSATEMSLGELTAAIALHKSTVHRLLMVLEAHRLVDKSPIHGRYRLGMKLFELGSHAVVHLNIRERARPRLQWLASQTGETVHLCVMDRGEMLCIDSLNSIESLESEDSLRISFGIGQRAAMHCSATGKAMLACLPEPSVREILRLRGMPVQTSQTLTTPENLMADLVRTCARGYALDKEEAEEGVRSIAVPVFNDLGGAIAAISVSGPASRLTDERTAAVVDVLRRVAREVARGHSGIVSPRTADVPVVSASAVTGH
jgi:DNA-binding IclR family transcriptional regulator